MTPIEYAIQFMGGSRQLGEALGVTRQAVEQWRYRGIAPPDRILAIERLTGVSRYMLRPDIFGPPPKNPKRRAEARAA